MRNVLYVHTHDTGRFIGPYDPGIPTPNLMKLAGEGTTFRNMYCCGPTCSPSRSALLTGQPPHLNGMLGLAHRGFSITDYSHHLANFLKTAGFETVLCGMQHEAAKSTDIGYDRVMVDPRREADDLTSWDESNAGRAIAFLREKHEKPFFLSYGLAHTHRPFLEMDSDIVPDYVKVPSVLPDTPEIRKDFARFLTSARRADHCIGRVLQELKDLGLEDDTLILYTTDHGIAFPYMKCSLYDAGIGVAMILKYPGNPAAGQVTDALLSQVDVFPTLCDLLEIEKPGWLTGTSFVPVLEAPESEGDRAVFAEITYHAAEQPQRCIRTRRYKYIKRFGTFDRWVPANIDNGPSKSFLLENGLLQQKVDREMLFDLYFDPGERNNLIRDPDYAETREELRGLLQQHMKQTGDFLQDGKLPRPKGLVLNRLSCIDPDSSQAEDYE